ncbi:MAG: glycosyltransferase family 2 protein [Pseudonocardiales bacterium]|nr:MAG: glycosyltransferase family 2 protein [Pseudonocardiales bacterium]
MNRTGQSSAESVCAVVVTYHPDRSALRAALAAVRPQVRALVVVDNASPGIRAALVDTGAVLLQQERNVGLARAQNIGIEWAHQHACSHVLILDQDSVPSPGMVDTLLDAWRRRSVTDRVGALGPRFRDSREQRDAPFIRVAFPMSRKLRCDGSTPEIECDFLISSGALIPLAVLDDVGGMDDGLFIDNVDMEWSFRARSRGYSLFGVCAATMEHHLGDERRPVLGGLRQVVTHGPARLYFIMRNRVALYRRRHTPRVWIAQDVPRVVAKFFIFSILVGPRRDNVRFMLRGLADGIRGRTGPCSLETTTR